MTARELGVGLQLNYTTLPLLDRIEAELALDYAELLIDTVGGALDSPNLVDPAALPLVERCRARWPLVAHSNFGQEFGFAPLEDTAAARRHVAIARMLDSPWIADHLFYGSGSISHAWSSPLQMSRPEIDRVVDRARALQDLAGRPLAHENGYFYNFLPGTDLGEPEFLSEIVRRAGTYLLLDLHNVYANSLVHTTGEYEPAAYLGGIPLDRVLEIHIAGGQWIRGWYHDLHNHPVPEPVWDMLRTVLGRSASVRAVTLEVQGPAHMVESRRIDDGWFDMIRTDLARARSLWDETAAVRRGRAP